MNDNTRALIDRLQHRIKSLFELHEKQRQNSVELQNQVQSLQAKLSDLNEQHEKLRANYEALRIAKVVESNAIDARQAKHKINELINEVNKCMALLNGE